jgi:hypothetical protein
MFHFRMLIFTYDLNLYIVSLNCKFHTYLYTVFSFCDAFYVSLFYVLYDYDMFHIPLSCDSLRDLWNEYICIYVCATILLSQEDECYYKPCISAQSMTVQTVTGKLYSHNRKNPNESRYVFGTYDISHNLSWYSLMRLLIFSTIFIKIYHFV